MRSSGSSGSSGSSRTALPLLLIGVFVVGSLVAWLVLERQAASARRDRATADAPGADRGAREPRDPADAANAANPLDLPTASREREAAAAPPAPVAEPLPLPLFPADRARGELVAVVVDASGRTTRGIEVTLRSTMGGFAAGLEIGDDRAIAQSATTGNDGRARFVDVPQGPYRLAAHAADGRNGRADVAFRAVRDEARVAIAIDSTEPRSELAVLVVDAAGVPVAGARVEAHGTWPGRGVVGSERLPALVGVTGDDGRVTFADAELDEVVLLARAPDGRTGTNLARRRAAVECDDREKAWHRVEVAAAATLTGTLVGVAPELTHCAELSVDLRTSEAPHYWSWGTSLHTTVANGAFRLEGLPAGRATLRLRSRDGVRLVAAPIDFGGPLENSARPPSVELKAGETKSIELAVAIGGTIRGRVVASDGAPIAGATVRETFAPATSNFPDGFVLHGVNVWRFDGDGEVACDHPFNHATARTDEGGEYELAGLQPGRHRIEVVAPRCALDRREAVAVADRATVALEHVLEAAGVLQGISNDEGYLGITRVGAQDPFAIAILPRSRAFTFSALPAGEYLFAQFHSDASVAPVELARASVVAGRTTWIDLTEVAGGHPITGRVVDVHGPVCGARVGIHWPTVSTGLDGRFTIPSAFALGDGASLHVELDGLRYLLPSIRPTAGSLPLELELGDGRLQVVTSGEEGRALAGTLSLTSADESAGEHRLHVESATIPFDASGRVTIDHLPPGSYWVTARFVNGAQRVERDVVPQSGPLDLCPPPCGEVAVVVRDAGGRRVRGCQVAVMAWLGEGEIPEDPKEIEGRGELFEWNSGYTDGAGRFHARGVRAGTVLVHAWGREGRPAWTRSPDAKFVLVADERRSIDITLPGAEDGRR